MNTPAERIKVWDPVVRLFHWTLVGAFMAAYLSGEEWLDLHVLAGYVVGGAIIVRLLWGFIGTRHARFTDFVRAPGEVVAYLRDVLVLRARRYLGHNPAGGAMVVLMLLSLVITVASGLVVYGAEEAAGPLAWLAAGVGEEPAEVVEEVHAFFANFILILAIAHVAGVLFDSLLHHENLVRAMFDGYKRP